MTDLNPDNGKELCFDKGSFRDRTNRIIKNDTCIYRVLNSTADEEYESLKNSTFYNNLINSQRIVKSTQVDIENFEIPDHDDSNWVSILEHERIPLISYPYEWSFSMLKDAALLHLELMEIALDDNMVLKDSSPYNIQWKGKQPIFIDIPSFIKYEQGQAWIGYKQFCELFLFPLMLQAYKDIPFQAWLKGNLNGISANDFANLQSFRDLFRPGVLLHGTLQSKLQNKYKNTDKSTHSAIKNAGFKKELIIHNINSMTKLIQKLEWGQSKSTWSNYINENNYSSDDMTQKIELVDKICSTNYKLVWDFGCNTGQFSRIAAKHADYVIAFDFDALAIDQLYKQLKIENNKKILPLVFDLSEPSPNTGWRNQERKTITERGEPELILSLALIHHLVITANIPLSEVIDYFYNVGGDLIIEFVDKNDSMVKRLLLNKEDNYNDYSIENIERLLLSHYKSFDKYTLNSGNRTLYYAKRN